jgi:hypothetical protein
VFKYTPCEPTHQGTFKSSTWIQITCPCALGAHASRSTLGRTCIRLLYWPTTEPVFVFLQTSFIWHGYKCTIRLTYWIRISVTMLFLSTGLVSISLLRFVHASAVDFTLERLFSRATGCSTTGPASCHNTTVQPNLCCFEYPGVSTNIVPTHAIYGCNAVYRRASCCRRRYVLTFTEWTFLVQRQSVLGSIRPCYGPSNELDSSWCGNISATTVSYKF